MLTHFSLFSGIGGLDLAATWAGFTTVGFCEIDPFCQDVLRKHWPGVPIWSDVRDVTGESVRKAGIGAVDLVSGGVPCQPASCAGKRRGTEDDRWLWPEALRVIAEIRPRWCLFENPTGILSLQGGVPFESVLSDLEAEGYETGAFIIPACAVGAPHIRSRVWIVAHSAGVERATGAEEQGILREVSGNGRECGNAGGSSEAQSGKDVADAQGKGLPHRRHGTITEGEGEAGRDMAFPELERCGEPGRKVESGVGGVLDGLPDWLHGHRWPAPCGCEQYEWEPPRVTAGKVPYRRQRLQALGNTVVPAQAYPILKAIAEVTQCVQEAESTIAR